MTRLLMSSVVLGLAAAPAFAQTASTTSSAQSATGKSADPNKVICHEEADTGSRLSKTRECHTRAEWAELQRQQRTDVERSQANGGH